MAKKSVASALPINSVRYWDDRFRADWDARGGPAQTRFFANVLVASLPDWIARRLDDGPFALLDVGCAAGEAIEVLGKRFGRMSFTGVDVSGVAIRRARKSYPQAVFNKVAANWRDLPNADLVLCSNTLEHLPDWRERLDRLCMVAARAVLVLVPYREGKLEAEHVARFDEREFPLAAAGMRLAYLRVVDTARMPDSRWNGRQILAVYASPAWVGAIDKDEIVGNLASGLDLRGSSDDRIAEALMNPDIHPEPASEVDAAPVLPAPGDQVVKLNREWKARFEDMVRSFEENQAAAAQDHRKVVEEYQEKLRTTVEENQQAFRRLVEERDAARLDRDMTERRLAFSEEMHESQMAHLRAISQKEQELQRNDAELAFARERQQRDGRIDALTLEIEAVRQRADMNEAALSGELSRLRKALALAEARHETEAREREADVSRLDGSLAHALSRHAEESGRLQAQVAEFEQALRSTEAELVQARDELAAERASVADALAVAERLAAERERLGSELAALNQTRDQQLAGLRASHDAEVERLAGELAAGLAERAQLENERDGLASTLASEVERLTSAEGAARAQAEQLLAEREGAATAQGIEAARMDEALATARAEAERLAGEIKSLEGLHEAQVADLLASHAAVLAGVDAGHATDLERLAAERDAAVAEAQVIRDTLLDSHVAELALVNDRHAQALDEARARQAAMAARLGAEVAELRGEIARREAEQAVMAAEHADEVGRIRSTNAIEARRLSEGFEYALGEKQALEARLAEQLEAHDAETARLRRLHEEIEAAASGHAQLAEARLAELDRIRAAHAEEVSRLVASIEERDERIVALADESALRAARLLGEREALQAAHAEAESQLRGAHAAEVARLASEIEAERRARQWLEAANAALCTEHAEEVARLRASERKVRLRFEEELSAALQFGSDLVAERAARISFHAAEMSRQRAMHAEQALELARLASERDGMSQRHEEELAWLQETSDRKLAQLADENAALAEARQDIERRHADAALRIKQIESELVRERDLSQHLASLHAELEQHYEQHLDGLNRELDRIAGDVGQLVDQVLAEDGDRLQVMEQVARHNAEVAVAWARHSREDVRSFPARLRAGWRALLGGGLTPVLRPLSVPEAAPSAAPRPAIIMMRHLLDALHHDRNYAGAKPVAPAAGPAAVTETPAAPAPPPVVTATSADARQGMVVAMQLQAFDRGGLERVVFDLCCGMRDAGVKVLVLCREAGLLAKELREHLIDVVTFADQAEYGETLRQQRVTHLFLHHAYEGLDVALGLGIKVFDVVHNSYFWKLRDPEPVRRVAIEGSGAICVSSAVREFHVRAFGIPAGNTRMINNPVNLDGLIVPDARQLLRVRTGFNQTTFLNVANAFPAKAQIAMIGAFARAYRLRPEIRLMIAGSPSTPDIAARIEALIEELGLQDAVTVLGHCSRRELSRRYAEAHAFVLPSIFEGYSISAIEAATFGLPLVMTDVGGARDLIDNGDCGILLPPIVEDLAAHTPEQIDAIGRADENAVTGALADAFVAIATGRGKWLERGLAAMTKPHSLPSVVREYLAVIEDAGRASAGAPATVAA